MSETTKTIKIYTKDNFNFTGILVNIDENFLIINDNQTRKEMVFPISNIARWVVEKEEANK